MKSGKQNEEFGNKKKNFRKGLDALFSRGQSKYKETKLSVEKAKHFAEVRKKKAYQRLLKAEGMEPMHIPEQLPDRPLPADSGSSDKSCSVSDEEIEDGDIMFKDADVQSQWLDGSRAGPSISSVKLKEKQRDETVKPHAKKTIKPLLKVPTWSSGDEAQSSDQVDEVGQQVANRSKSASHGDKTMPTVNSAAPSKKKPRPNPFQEAKRQADEQRRLEREQREAEEAAREASREGRQAYFRKRREERSKHLRRTTHGQPLMRNVLGRLLDKLQRDQ